MKYIIIILLILSLGSILAGYFLDVSNPQKFIGFGVLGIFFAVFPLFSYHRWKDKDPKNYMLTKENIDKMKESQRRNKH